MVEALKRDWKLALLSGRERAILSYTTKLTMHPTQVTNTDVDGLRGEGLNDQEILAVVMLVGFFQLATRIADALGVELDPELTRGSPEYEKFLCHNSGETS